VEVAIRRAAAASMGRGSLWARPGAHLEAAARSTPTVLFRTGAFPRTDRRPPVRRSVTIQLSSLRLLFRQGDTPRELTAMKPRVWTLRPGAIPWWSDDDRRRPGDTPSASLIWEWASLPPDLWSAGVYPQSLFESEEAGRPAPASTVK
jgi:hypothetical protein